jgi:sarcosine oxidase gamma subunit
MRYAPFLRVFLTTLQAWWQQQVEKAASVAPYPLGQDEWNCIQEQEKERVQACEAVASTTTWVDSSGLLVGIDSVGGA